MVKEFKELAGFKFIVEGGFHSEAPVALKKVVSEVKVAAPVIKTSNEDVYMPSFLARHKAQKQQGLLETDIPEFIKKRRNRKMVQSTPSDNIVSKVSINRLSGDGMLASLANAFRRLASNPITLKGGDI